MKNFIKISLAAFLLVFIFIGCEKESGLIVTDMADNPIVDNSKRAPIIETPEDLDRLIITSQWYTDNSSLLNPHRRVINYIMDNNNYNSNGDLKLYLLKELYNGFREPNFFTLQSQVNSSGHTQYRFIAEFLAPGSDTFWTNGISGVGMLSLSLSNSYSCPQTIECYNFNLPNAVTTTVHRTVTGIDGFPKPNGTFPGCLTCW
jgi:hypothetical protein